MRSGKIDMGFRFDAVPLKTVPRTWAAQFHAPGHGVRFVRDGNGAFVRHESEEAARAAALDAMMLALNGRVRGPVRGKAQRVMSRSRGGVVFA